MARLKTATAETKTQGDLRGHNTRMQLLSFVERYERLEEERQGLKDDQGEVMDEAKSFGLDLKTLRKVIARRKMDPADRLEQDGILETYEDAIREAEKQQVAKSVEEGSEPHGGVHFADHGNLTPPEPAPAPKKKLWGKKPEQPKQMDVEELAPSDNEVTAEAARQITHAADHPEKADGEIPSFLRRGK